MMTTQNDHHFYKIRLKESASACPHNDSVFPICWGLTRAEMTFQHHKVWNICMLVHHHLHIGAMGGVFPISQALSALKRHSFKHSSAFSQKNFSRLVQACTSHNSPPSDKPTS